MPKRARIGGREESDPEWRQSDLWTKVSRVCARLVCLFIQSLEGTVGDVNLTHYRARTLNTSRHRRSRDLRAVHAQPRPVTAPDRRCGRAAAAQRGTRA